MIRIGIDIGGTFTDFVVQRPERGRIESFKLLSTPSDPAAAVLQGLARILQDQNLPGEPLPPVNIVHGSTVATNALLERKGAPVALVATLGFADLLEIGRQNRPALYDFNADPSPPLAPPGMRFEVEERVGADGQVIVPLDPASLEHLPQEIGQAGAASVAVCLLFSFLHPEHEKMIGERLRAAGLFVSLSSEILPEFREYERASTTAVNAYVSPVMERYLARLEEELPGTAGPKAALRVMQSNGGQISVAEARRAGVRCILSGPAGGIIGARHVAGLAAALAAPHDKNLLPDMDLPGFNPARLITFDMGGTSTDVSLVDGQPQLTSESIVGGCPIRIPVLDIHTIGAGGGSIASVDLGGALRVGPESAGADPGPACYGVGELPTVTDANLVLGRLAPEHFLGGAMLLDPSRAHKALASLGRKLSMDAASAALGVIAVVNAHMERALRLISVERGRDPGRAGGQPFTLLSFGGAGGLHAADLARHLGIPYVLISPLASTLSAFGMLAADVVKDYARTVMLPGETPFSQVEQALSGLAETARAEMQAEGLSPHQIAIEPLLDLRYAGQSYELSVPLPESGQGFASAFHLAHKRIYGYDRPGAPLEIVNVRLRAIGQVEPPPMSAQPRAGSDPSQALLETRPVTGPQGHSLQVPFYRFESLLPGNRLEGPALAVRSDTTVWLGTGDRGTVDGYGNLLIEVGG
jgi:N-methylhydantoinase A